MRNCPVGKYLQIHRRNLQNRNKLFQTDNSGRVTFDGARAIKCWAMRKGFRCSFLLLTTAHRVVMLCVNNDLTALVWLQCMEADAGATGCVAASPTSGSLS